MADPEFPASLVELPEPELPSAAWARVEVVTGGIGGSDLHLFAHHTGPSPTLSEVDLTPIWYKEAALVGSIDHTVDSGSAPGIAGVADRHSVDRALDILAAGLLPLDIVVTHEFALEDYRDAVATAIDRSNAQAIKVVFRP
jgi:threonine dehydrogenase-like Zn-dependent dehydrogenase